VAWFAVLRWWPGARLGAALVLLGVSTPPALHTIVLHQPTALVGALLAGAGVALVRGRYGLAGILLALTTIKPQVSVFLILWLGLWAFSDWRRRRGLVIGFAVVQAALLAGAWLLMPTWVGEWITALVRYQYSVGERPILAAWLPEPLVPVVQVALGLVWAAFGWRARRVPPGSLAFSLGLALPLLYSILLLPVWTPYNQILLFPAALLVLQHRAALLALGRAGRLVYAVTVSVLIWPLLAMTLWMLLWAGGVLLLDSPLVGALLTRFVQAPWVIELAVPLVLLVPLSLLAWPVARRWAAVPS
jgi:hypothetical protein